MFLGKTLSNQAMDFVLRQLIITVRLLVQLGYQRFGSVK